MSEEMKRFGEKLRSLRVRHGYTLKDLALAIDHTAHGYLSELESGKKKPTADFVLKISRFFNISADNLLKDELSEINYISNSKNRRRMTSAFLDRNPTPKEIEKLRLVLTFYQDGSGMLMQPDGKTLPGWRDFERSVAVVFDGKTTENKSIFDVSLNSIENTEIHHGLSCKMRRELNRIKRDGRVTIELSNSSGKFWDELARHDLNQNNYRNFPNEVGIALINLVNRWHQESTGDVNGHYDLGRGSYLVLSWNTNGQYQLHQFNLQMPDPVLLRWEFPRLTARGSNSSGKRLRGSDQTGTAFEWYGESGGQLKYYPCAIHAIWASDIFTLMPLPDLNFNIEVKASAYFPSEWISACDEEG